MFKPVIKRSYKGIENDLIYRFISIGSYLPAGYCLCIYDRNSENVVIRDGQFDVGNRNFPSFNDIGTLPVKETITINRQVLERIKTLILYSGVLNIKSFDIPDYIVLDDGTSESLYFCVNGKRKYIEGDDIFMIYKNNRTVNIVSKLVDDIDAVLSKYHL